jgi:hypothetical protein
VNPLRRIAIAALGAAAWSVLTVAVFGQATLTLTFEEMNPHIGQGFELRVVDAATRREIDRLSVAEIPATAFDLAVADVPLGSSYRIDFYVDANGNGHYDAPPIDHAWRLELPDLQADASLVFVHNLDFTDIAWPPYLDGILVEAEYEHEMLDVETGMTVHWQHDGTLLYVGLEAPGSGWLSIGFGPERRMEGANILIAAIVDGVLTIADHYGNTQTSHRADTVDHIVQAAGSEAAGLSIVEFAIPLDSGDSEDTTLAPGDEVVIILAYHGSNDRLTARHTKRSTSSIVLDD